MNGRIAKLLRSFRMASTAFFGILFVSFAALWARSFHYIDGGYFYVLPNQHIKFLGGSGRMCVWFEHSAAPKWFDGRSRVNDQGPVAPKDRMPFFDLAFFWPTMTRLYVAHWFLAISTLVLAIAPWCPRKFSAQGMLIAVTVVCAVIAITTLIDRTFQ